MPTEQYHEPPHELPEEMAFASQKEVLRIWAERQDAEWPHDA